MSDLCEQIQELMRDGYTAHFVALTLEIPVQWVYEALEIQED